MASDSVALTVIFWEKTFLPESIGQALEGFVVSSAERPLSRPLWVLTPMTKACLSPPCPCASGLQVPPQNRMEVRSVQGACTSAGAADYKS